MAPSDRSGQAARRTKPAENGLHAQLPATDGSGRAAPPVQLCAAGTDQVHRIRRRTDYVYDLFPNSSNFITVRSSWTFGPKSGVISLLR